MNYSNQTQQPRNANPSVGASVHGTEPNNARTSQNGSSRPPPPRRDVDPYAGFMPQTVENFLNPNTESNTPSAPPVSADVTGMISRTQN